MEASKARLRTKTGCNSCRKRRKKCDEVKPTCTLCRRASINCIWSTARQLRSDGRHRTGRALSTSKRLPTQLSSHDAPDVLSRRPRMLSLPLPAVKNKIPISLPWSSRPTTLREIQPAPTLIFPTIPFDATEESALFSYYLNHLLPSTIHEGSYSRHCDFSYWSSMAVAHQPLMDTAVACAAMSMCHKLYRGTGSMAKMKQKALMHQTSAVASIREFLDSGKATGSEDWLLAVVESLILFNYRDPDAIPAYASPHVTAMAEIFKCRQASKRSRGSLPPTKSDQESSPVLIFERICYESLLYHSTILMWFDRSLDALTSDADWELVEEYFHDSLSPETVINGRWPILGVPYELFKLITTILRLSRQTRLSEDDLVIAATVSNGLARWEVLVDTNCEYSVAKLYVYVVRSLLQFVLSCQTEVELSLNATSANVRRCMSMLASTTTTCYFSGYQFWPLTVLGHLATEPDDKHLITDRLASVIRNMDSLKPTHP